MEMHLKYVYKSLNLEFIEFLRGVRSAQDYPLVCKSIKPLLHSQIEIDDFLVRWKGLKWEEGINECRNRLERENIFRGVNIFRNPTPPPPPFRISDSPRAGEVNICYYPLHLPLLNFFIIPSPPLSDPPLKNLHKEQGK